MNIFWYDFDIFLKINTWKRWNTATRKGSTHHVTTLTVTIFLDQYFLSFALFASFERAVFCHTFHFLFTHSLFVSLFYANARLIALPRLLSTLKASDKLQLTQIKWWQADEKSQQDGADSHWRNSLTITQLNILLFLKWTDGKKKKKY